MLCDLDHAAYHGGGIPGRSVDLALILKAKHEEDGLDLEYLAALRHRKSLPADPVLRIPEPFAAERITNAHL
jgi:hypothetical protein